jgi:hypothetical protein
MRSTKARPLAIVLETALLPEPVVGRNDAPIVLLFLNPRRERRSVGLPQALAIGSSRRAGASLCSREHVAPAPMCQRSALPTGGARGSGAPLCAGLWDARRRARGATSPQPNVVRIYRSPDEAEAMLDRTWTVRTPTAGRVHHARDGRNHWRTLIPLQGSSGFDTAH